MRHLFLLKASDPMRAGPNAGATCSKCPQTPSIIKMQRRKGENQMYLQNRSRCHVEDTAVDGLPEMLTVGFLISKFVVFYDIKSNKVYKLLKTIKNYLDNIDMLNY